MTQLYRDLPVTILGLGSFGGGVAAARFLAEHGARVTITDLKSEQELAESLAALADVPIERLALGGHPPAVFEACRLLVVNPAVPPNHPGIATATAAGAEITTEIEIFLRHNQGRVIGITGSNGKSTTSALTHHLLCQSGLSSWLGGNIGVSLLPQLARIQPTDLVVLELSSFQLELLRQRRFRPEIAVLTNFSQNHLDWHGTLDAYRLAKQSIFSAQLSTDISLIPASEEQLGCAGSEWRIRGRRHEFGTADSGTDGAFVESGSLILRTSRGRFEDSLQVSIPPQLPGEHNACNIAAAAAAAWLAGANPQTFAKALQAWRPLPHRLQCVADRAGRQFWNDSIATTPESAIAALKHMSGRAVILAGGYDKGQDLQTFADAICQHSLGVVLMGQTALTLKQRIEASAAGPAPSLAVASDFPAAFQMAVAMSAPGDIVLLSPGCASYGWFRDYRDRGDQFTRMAQEWSPLP